MEKLMKYINSHPEYNMKLVYSTPSLYMEAVHARTHSYPIHILIHLFFFFQQPQKILHGTFEPEISFPTLITLMRIGPVTLLLDLLSKDMRE